MSRPSDPIAYIPYGAYWSTPFARWQGAFANLHSLKFAAWTAERAMRKREIDPAALSSGVLGFTVPQRGSFYGLPYVAGLMGAPHLAGPTIMQACATSLRSIAHAAGEVASGQAGALLAITADRVSNGPQITYPAPYAPGGAGEQEIWVLDNFARDPFAKVAMIETAENVARKYRVTCDEQNEIVLRRQAQYADALVDNHAFQRRYMDLPFETPDPRFTAVAGAIEGDQGVQPPDEAKLRALKPLREDGTVTYAGQTHPADGNAGLVVASRDRARALARAPIEVAVLGFGQARVEPAFMPEAPVPASRRALEAAGVSIVQLDAVKSHNPFAVNDAVFARETGFSVERMNNFGCSLIWGHPQGPTGMRGVIELIEELAMRGGGTGLFQGCAAGDTAMAMVVRVGGRAVIAYADGRSVWTPATTLDLLDRAAAERPDAVALVCGHKRVTYAEYAHCVAVLAGRLAEGERGRPVVIALRNGLAICIAIFAVQRAGLVPATLNPDYGAREVAPMLETADPALVIGHAELAERYGGAPFLGVEDDAGFVDALLAGPLPPPLPLVDPEADAVLQFTGGTTGRPKGVLLTHRAVATNMAQREARLPTEWGDERIVCAMPLFHVFAVAMGLHMAAYAGGTLIILPKYRPETLLEAIASERATRLPAGPTLFNSLLGYEGLTRETVATLRCCYSGSAPLSVATLDCWERVTGVPIYEGYGQSEAGPVLTYTGPHAPSAPGTVGTALPLTEIRVVDPDSAEPLPPGMSGEIVARGPQIMRGYLNDSAATAKALRDGWLHTGDIGRLDAAGALRIEDRKKDMAIVGGFNVYPREVDELLMAHPKVAEAAAIGVPDSYRGETLQAWVVGRDNVSIAELNAWCAENLVRYKWPTAIYLVPELPRTAAGKVDKAALRCCAAGALSHVA